MAEGQPKFIANEPHLRSLGNPEKHYNGPKTFTLLIDLSGMDAEWTKMKADMTEINADMTEMEAGSTEMKAQAAEMKAKVTEMNAKMKRIQTRLQPCRRFYRDIEAKALREALANSQSRFKYPGIIIDDLSAPMAAPEMDAIVYTEFGRTFPLFETIYGFGIDKIIERCSDPMIRHVIVKHGTAVLEDVSVNFNKLPIQSNDPAAETPFGKMNMAFQNFVKVCEDGYEHSDEQLQALKEFQTLYCEYICAKQQRRKRHASMPPSGGRESMRSVQK